MRVGSRGSGYCFLLDLSVNPTIRAPLQKEIKISATPFPKHSMKGTHLFEVISAFISNCISTDVHSEYASIDIYI